MSFHVPPYPYDRLRPIIEIAQQHAGGAVDCSIGTPCDDPPPFVLSALGDAQGARTYPASKGSPGYREAASHWMRRMFGISIDPNNVAACVGTKEFVASTPHLLKLRTPQRSTVLYPAIAYPTYEMGARLAGCRPVAVPVDSAGQLDLGALSPTDVSDALCIWVNTPSNPTGAVSDLTEVVEWAQRNGVTVLSDECYVEFTWATPAQSVLVHSTHNVLAVHSLSKRSNFAGARAGFYAGDPDLVDYLCEVRKHMGLMVPGGVQVAGELAWNDDAHVAEQRERYRGRLRRLIQILGRLGVEASMPEGAFYVWASSSDEDAWELAGKCASACGLVVSPGEFYGADCARYIRVAAVQPDSRLELLEQRLAM